MENAASRKKNIGFFIYYTLVIIFMTFPGVFDLANKIDPWVLGLPFSAFYLFLCVSLLFLGLIFQYRIEDKLGELDIEVEIFENDENGGKAK
ncbi:hypothetical protein [Neobacillus mesonae]|uniref:hypothetical protein n=1 Tax=Neobacillus mesonae TaxID=1193713 RepID=UPI00203CBFD5|nr:hypothetical protein [Neobacillus mesonae]MCM3568110.1 hypothetical protein [Neobacillus mesonae]